MSEVEKGKAGLLFSDFLKEQGTYEATTEQAITLLYTQIVKQRGIPLSLKIPNETLEKVMREARDPDFKKKAKSYGSAREMFNDLDF